MKWARTDNASLLEASIDQIVSSEKLNGDTVNLYFDFLRNNRAFGGGNWEFSSSYFYPSLHRPVETSTYSKHIGNNALWEDEQLIVPLHLLIYAFTFMIPLEQRTEKFLIPSKKDLLETNFSGFLMRTKLSSRKIIGTSPYLNVPTKERCWLWCIHTSFCKALIVVERQPFRPYSQRRASSWNGERSGDMALLGHEAELHYHSLERMASQNPQLAIAEELKQKYGHGKITEEIFPKCGRKFQWYSQGVFESGGTLQYYSDDSVFCNSCLMDEF